MSVSVWVTAKLLSALLISQAYWENVVALQRKGIRAADEFEIELEFPQLQRSSS